jgi:hypothetical protein
VLLEDHALPLVAVSLWVGSGSKDEVESSAGYAHFLEHLIQRGTDSSGPFEYTRKAQRWGGALSVRANYDRTAITLSGVPTSLEDLIQAAASMAFKATLKDTEIDQELGTLSQEIRTYYDLPSSVSLFEGMRAAFPGHPYRFPSLGHFRSVGTLKAEPLSAFYKNLYVPNNMAIAVAGDFDARAAASRIGPPSDRRRRAPPCRRAPRRRRPFRGTPTSRRSSTSASPGRRFCSPGPATAIRIGRRSRPSPRRWPIPPCRRCLWRRRAIRTARWRRRLSTVSRTRACCTSP